MSRTGAGVEPHASELTGPPGHEVVRSPEQVALHLPLAGPMSRALAFAVDFALLVLLQFLLLIVLLAAAASWIEPGQGFEWTSRFEADDQTLPSVLLLAQAVFVLVQFVLQWGYFVVCELATNGRSPGKAVLGLRVVRDGGLPLTPRASVLRNLMRLVDMLPSAYLVGFVSIVASPRGKRLGDYVAGTIVVREDRPATAAPLDLREAPGRGEPVYRFDRAQIEAVGPAERRLLRRTLRRVESLSPERARGVLDRTTAAMCRRIGREEEVAESERLGFLRALLRATEES